MFIEHRVRLLRALCTGHRVVRVLSFFSSRRNWDSPTPSPAGACAPLCGTGEKNTAGEGGGGLLFKF